MHSTTCTARLQRTCRDGGRDVDLQPLRQGDEGGQVHREQLGEERLQDVQIRSEGISHMQAGRRTASRQLSGKTHWLAQRAGS